MDDYDKLYASIRKKKLTIDVLRELISNIHVESIKPCGLSDNGDPLYEIKIDNGDKEIVCVIDYVKICVDKTETLIKKISRYLKRSRYRRRKIHRAIRRFVFLIAKIFKILRKVTNHAESPILLDKHPAP